MRAATAPAEELRNLDAARDAAALEDAGHVE
jgi:hypothetical protein